MLASAAPETKKLGQMRAEVDQFSPTTTERFDFDSYCAAQVFLFLEPAASGAVFWNLPQLCSGAEEVDVGAFVAENPFGVIEPTISGALFLDSNQLFWNAHCANWNTSLQPLPHRSRSALPFVANVGWSNFLEYLYSFFARYANPASDAEPSSLSLPLSTPYADLLKELYSASPWRSWKKLGPLLGTSHAQLQRIAKRRIAVPQADLASRIDDFYTFFKRLAHLSGGDATTTTRLLTTRRARDGESANEFLLRQDYRNAFRAIMEAASPRRILPHVDVTPYRWYDEPSKDLYSDGDETDD
jgi:hypothetical protein